MTRTALVWISLASIGCGGGGTGTSDSAGSTGDTTGGATTSEATTTAAPTSDPPTTDTPTTDSSVGGTGTTTTGEPTTGPSTGDPATSDPLTGTSDPGTGTTGDTTDTGSSTGPSCGPCDQPNQQCIDDQCVTSCQGQDPDPCGPAQVCDVISGECKDPGDTCVLDGPATPCGASTCGPGSVCDGIETCLPIAPCASVVCTADGACWGNQCACERAKDCMDAPLEVMNGPFSKDIGGIDFADDCTAWMVTLRSGTDYLRRLKPDGEVTEWAGVANLNMGEVKVLRSLTVPQLTVPFPVGNAHVPPPEPIEGIGEVAISYTCCPSCGCQADPPQGVARLVEDDINNPLPIVIIAQKTQGTGPFNSLAADAGPQGLTWGVDRVLYVGNSTNNGDFNSADLEKVQQAVEYKFPARVSAAAPVSPAHLVVGLIGGEVHRFNVLTKQAELLLDLGVDITGFSHDSFTGQVYAGLANLDIVAFDPFTAAVTDFAKMPGKGRVTVSPSGNLYFAPIRYLYAGPITSYPLPGSF